MSFLAKIFKSKNSLKEFVDRVIAERLSYLGKPALIELAEAVEEMESTNVTGVIVEAGCALGGSSIVISYAKKKDRDFYIYDIFGTIPSPGEQDPEVAHQRYKEIIEGKSDGIDGDKYYGYQDLLLHKVIQNFKHFEIEPEQNNITFVQGLYEETMLIDFPVALAHIDCDWYDSVLICLKQIVPRMTPNALLILDDYYYWPGCKKAVDDYFQDKKSQFIFIEKSRLHIRKK